MALADKEKSSSSDLRLYDRIETLASSHQEDGFWTRSYLDLMGGYTRTKKQDFSNDQITLMPIYIFIGKDWALIFIMNIPWKW